MVLTCIWSFCSHIFLFFPFVPSKTFYYFNKHLVLMHYWSLGWTKGHCIRTRIPKPIIVWHLWTHEKLYQLWNQPTTASKNNQLSHWKAFCPTMLLGLWFRCGRVGVWCLMTSKYPFPLLFFPTPITIHNGHVEGLLCPVEAGRCWYIRWFILCFNSA